MQVVLSSWFYYEHIVGQGSVLMNVWGNIVAAFLLVASRRLLHRSN